MKKAFPISMIMVGTMIGAGYASGQEIAAFFGFAPGIFVPIFCGVLFFVFSVVLLMVGNRLKTDSLSLVNTKLFGKLGGAVDIAMLFNALVVLAAMMAGLDDAFYILTGLRLPYGVLIGLLSAYVLRFNKGMQNANLVVVPLIIIFLAITCLTTRLEFSTIVTLPMVLNCFTYVSMNLLLSAGVLVRVHGLTTRQIVISSAISSAIIAALMALIAAVLPNAQSEVMPLISVASSGIIYYLFITSLIIAIFTTLLSSLSTLRSWSQTSFGNGTLGAIISLIAAGILSCFGFEAVVNIFYPIIGVIGLVYILFSIFYLFRSSVAGNKLLAKCHHRIHKRGKRAQHHGAGHH